MWKIPHNLLQLGRIALPGPGHMRDPQPPRRRAPTSLGVAAILVASLRVTLEASKPPLWSLPLKRSPSPSTSSSSHLPFSAATLERLSLSPPPGYDGPDESGPPKPRGVLGRGWRALRAQGAPPPDDGRLESKMYAQRWGGALYATREDFRRAGVEYESADSELNDYGAVFNSKKALWEPDYGSDPEAYQFSTTEPVLHRGEQVPVLGVEFGEAMDDEQVVLTQIRLAIDRADHDCLRAALHNAAEVEQADWTEKLDAAFEAPPAPPARTPAACRPRPRAPSRRARDTLHPCTRCSCSCC